ncbi:MAG: iron-containing alcohol dehydrogenase [Anaerovibrio sp.]|uniref:iron-containing alcohol dehydrogenase n=1 Tax=Anaerovibrio sp. TaxID=1872532 RepID=UPI0025DC4DEA|nr:iron-containing alcohol dehydrogenase [Anaerovibrio sp.]MCR5175222.1 iron-containing alcohol dehydrogenase [Anaerovibrio sp.]
MQNFEFYCPTDIVFGKNAEAQTAAKVQQYGGSRVMVIYGGGSVERSGLLKRIEENLTAGDILFKTLGGVQPNPVLSFAQKAVKEAIDFGADMVLAVGGGSVIDTAKAVAVGVANPEVDIMEYWDKGRTFDVCAPIGVVLTIAAAGSETSDSAVLTIDGTGRKGGAHSDLIRPDFAIMNPELTFTLPPYQIACGVADIIMHTLERYISYTEDNVFTDLVAEALMTNVIKYGRIAVAHRKNYQAMSEIMWCGSVSHNGFTGLGRGKEFSAHKLGHVLSGVYDVTHGASLAVMWPAWARFVYEDNPERFAQYAERVWGVNAGTAEERSRAGIRMTREFFEQIGLPTNFSKLGIGVLSDADIEKLADICTANDSKKVGVFHPMSKADVMAIYQSVNK